MSNITIKKAKINDKLFLEGEYSEQLPVHNRKNTKFYCTVPVHEDLKNAFQRLVPHLAILCDEISCPKTLEKVKEEDIKAFHVRSFSIGDSDENEGVTVSGYKEGKFGIVNLNTPFTKFENENYPFHSSLAQIIEACKYEVKEYLFNEKRAPEPQISLEFPEYEYEFENE